MKNRLIKILIFSLVAFANLSVAESQPIKIDPSEFNGFQKCEISERLGKIIKNIVNKYKPIYIYRQVLIYSIESKFLTIPVTEIGVGYCSKDGDLIDRGCGAASFTSLTLDLPFEDAKEKLQKITGKDFTKEVRDTASDANMRPILQEIDSENQSEVYCDSGSL